MENPDSLTKPTMSMALNKQHYAEMYHKWQEAKIKRYREALLQIEAFGHGAGHGSGYTCANMAKKALLEYEDTNQPAAVVLNEYLELFILRIANWDIAEGNL